MRLDVVVAHVEIRPQHRFRLVGQGVAFVAVRRRIRPEQTPVRVGEQVPEPRLRRSARRLLQPPPGGVPRGGHSLRVARDDGPVEIVDERGPLPVGRRRFLRPAKPGRTEPESDGETDHPGHEALPGNSSIFISSIFS